MGKINFVKGQRHRQNNKGYKNIINPFDYGTDEYWNRRENLERFLNYTSDKVYWMWVNEEVNDSQAVAMAELESGEVFNPNTEYANGGMFGDGGEVAQKIKDKLAKGSFELPMEMIVYVPSTKDGNVIIPKGDFQARVKNVRAFLATKFGGFSSNPTDGGYMSNDNKGLIEEDVVKVTAFATKEALEENLSPLLKKIQYWCKAWSQESIGFEFEGDLFYISATSKFMNGGMTYRNGSKTWIVMAVTNNGLLLSERLNKSITHEEVYNRYKKQGYEVVDSQVLHTTNSDVLDVFKDAVTEFVLEKYDKQIDWDLSILSYKIIDNKMIVGKCVVTTIDGNEYEISPNDLLNNKYAKGGMTYGGGGMTEDQDNRTMIMRQAKEVAHHVEELNEILSKQPDIDAWVVAKMQDVTTQLSEVTHYLDSRVGFRLGGDNIQKVQDSMLANGARLDRKKIVVILKDKDLGYDYYTIKDYMTGEHIASIKGLSSAEQYVDSQEYRLQYAEDWEDEDSMLANGGEIILGGGNMASVQDSIMERGAKLDDTQSNIKNIKSQLEKYQTLAADYMHKKRNPTYSPYDKDIDRLQKDLAQKLEENNIYNFDTEDDLVVRTEKNRKISKEIQMAQSWLPRMRSPYRPTTYSYSKFVRSLITPMQKDVFQKLQKEYWQRAWNTKIKISPKKDTIEFEHYNKKKGNWYNMEEGGQTLASVQDSIMARGAKLKSENVNEFDLEGFSYEIYFRLENPDITIKKEKSGRYAIFKGISYIGSNPTLEAARQQAYYLHDKIKKRNTKYSNGAKLKSGKLSLSKLKSMIEEYNSQGRNFELLGAYNQLELWSNDNRLETGSKEDIYRALVRYRFNPKYANGAKLPIDLEEIPNFGSMSDEDIIEFANTMSYYDRMDEGIEEEFTNVEDAMEYLRMTYEGE